MDKKQVVEEVIFLDDDEEDPDIVEEKSARADRVEEEESVNREEDEEEIYEVEPEDNLSSEEEFKQQKNGERGAGRKRKMSGERIEEESSEDDYVPSPPPPKKKRGRPKSAALKQTTEKNKSEKPKGRCPKPPKQVIKCKTIFKKNIIQNCLKCEDRRDDEDDESLDAIVKHYMRYDIERDKFFVGAVEVFCDEEKKCIKCSACDKIFGVFSPELRLIPGNTPLPSWQMIREMKLHIIGRHLEGDKRFTCYLCDEPYRFHTRGSTHYYRHMGTFHPLEGKSPGGNKKGKVKEKEGESPEEQETSS